MWARQRQTYTESEALVKRRQQAETCEERERNKKRLRTLSVVAGVDAVPRHRDVLVLVVERLQEGHQVLVVRQLLGHREGDDHHVDGRVALGEGAEQRGDGPVQLFHRALRRGRRVAVVLGVTHPWTRKTLEEIQDKKSHFCITVHCKKWRLKPR